MIADDPEIMALLELSRIQRETLGGVIHLLTK